MLGEGVREIYIFGSLVEGEFTERSDIDIATVGLREDRYFKVYGELLMKLSRDFDLVGLDYENDFSRMIKETCRFE